MGRWEGEGGREGGSESNGLPFHRRYHSKSQIPVGYHIAGHIQFFSG